jgi:hypothetical protein
LHLGVYFLREFVTSAMEKNQKEASRDDYLQKTKYAGLKFEQLVTTGGDKDKDKTQPIDTNEELHGVFSGLHYNWAYLLKKI